MEGQEEWEGSRNGREGGVGGQEKWEGRRSGGKEECQGRRSGKAEGMGGQDARKSELRELRELTHTATI